MPHRLRASSHIEHQGLRGAHNAERIRLIHPNSNSNNQNGTAPVRACLQAKLPNKHAQERIIECVLAKGNVCKARALYPMPHRLQASSHIEHQGLRGAHNAERILLIHPNSNPNNQNGTAPVGACLQAKLPNKHAQE